MKKRIKKAFTLVELLVVIAILAVLSTVAVVGYSSFTNKAQISADEQAVTQMNKVLAADEVADGKPTSVSEVVDVLIENGYSDGFSTYYSKYTLGWVAEDNVIVLVENGAVVYPESYTNVTAWVELNPMVESTSDLLSSIANVQTGEVIYFNSNVATTSEEDLLFGEGEFTLDLNGHTLSTNNPWNGFGLYAYYDTDLTIADGVIEAGEDVKYALTSSYGASLTLDNVIATGGNVILAYVSEGSYLTITDSKLYGVSGANAIQCYGGTLELNNVTVSQVGDAEKSYYSSAIQVINNQNSGCIANVEINGGTYVGKKAIQVSLPGGNVVINGGNFIGTEAVINNDYKSSVYPDFESSITINDGNFDGAIIINGDATFVINGGTFTNTGLTEEAFLAYVSTGSTVVFEGKTITK